MYNKICALYMFDKSLVIYSLLSCSFASNTTPSSRLNPPPHLKLTRFGDLIDPIVTGLYSYNKKYNIFSHRLRDFIY
jgi:hypothetical protein